MLKRIRNKVLAGKRLSFDDGVALYESDDIFTLGEMASAVSKAKNGNRAYYVRNIHINPTNICVNRCKFCAYSKSKGEEGAFELTAREIISKIKRASKTQPIAEVHIVGGLHPDWPFKRYLSIVRSVRKSFPSIHIKAFTATEIEYFSEISGYPIERVLGELKSAGLDSMPGGGAEIFDQTVRDSLCPEKISGAAWLDIMRIAHKLGIRSNATMLYGHLESIEHRVGHLMKLRELQDETGGFQAFIPLSYHPKNTEIGGVGSSGLDDLKTIAISRLMLDNFNHIKAYWVMLGEKVSQMSLLFGADDLDGTVIEEKIAKAAGGDSGGAIAAQKLHDIIKRTGRRPVERDSYYKAVGRAAR